MGPISWGVYPWQAFPAKCNLTLDFWMRSWCQCFKTALLRRWWRGQISWSICPWQAFPSWPNTCGWVHYPTQDRYTSKVLHLGRVQPCLQVLYIRLERLAREKLCSLHKWRRIKVFYIHYGWNKLECLFLPNILNLFYYFWLLTSGCSSGKAPERFSTSQPSALNTNLKLGIKCCSPKNTKA